jgi:DNA-binding MarR family transcriptional regulator
MCSHGQGIDLLTVLAYAERCIAYACDAVLQQGCRARAEGLSPHLRAVGRPRAADGEEDGATLGYLRKRRGLDAPTITGIIRRLELSGLVERRHDQGDRRVVHVFLTSEGHAARHVLSEVMKAFIARVQQNVTAQEQEILRDILQRLISNTSIAPGLGDRFGLLLSPLNGGDSP